MGGRAVLFGGRLGHLRPGQRCRFRSAVTVQHLCRLDMAWRSVRSVFPQPGGSLGTAHHRLGGLPGVRVPRRSAAIRAARTVRVVTTGCLGIGVGSRAIAVRARSAGVARGTSSSVLPGTESIGARAIGVRDARAVGLLPPGS